MPFQISLDKKIHKQLPKLPKKIQNRFQSTIDEIGENPYDGKPLKYKLKRYHSWRIGDYRVIYEILAQESIIKIKAVGHRKNIYDIIRRLMAILFSI